MLSNKVKAALQRGEAVLGSCIDQYMRPVTARFMANAGFEFLFIDTEHNYANPGALFDVVQACRAYDISPIVRVPDTEYNLIARSLDTGAQGIIVPRVESREQAEKVVECSKFRPVGRRGFGTEAIMDFKSTDLSEALSFLNEQLLIVVQIESAEAIECVDEIASVTGIDVVLIGPVDLSIALGTPGDTRHPRFVEAVDHVISVCQAKHVTAGFFGGSADDLAPWYRKGARFLVCGSESGILRQAATALFNELKTMVSSSPDGSSWKRDENQ